MAIALTGNATEYFVGKQGNDANDGTNKAKSFLTIQKGLDALQAGDVLTIGPGEYFEAVRRENLGNADVDTTIRAEIAGTVLLRGDVEAPEFKKVDGYRFLFAAKFDQTPQVVIETDTLTPMTARFPASTVEYSPGTYHYDESSKTLYISSSDLMPPSHHRYTIAVTPQSGLWIGEAHRVILDGLSATGYFSNTPPPSGKYDKYIWGIVLVNPVKCVIRNCMAYLNDGGIAMVGGHDNIIEKCIAFRNTPLLNGESGNIMYMGSSADSVIQDCMAYGSSTSGIKFYGGIHGPVRLKNNIAWGNGDVDLQIKGFSGTNPHELGFMENCVALSRASVYFLDHCIIAKGNDYNTHMPEGVISPLPAEANQVQEFADPLNFDFHLQSTSSYRGTGPGGSDRGAYPYKPDIFYVAMNGQDSNDGLSVGKAWRTLEAALGKLKAGDTLYLLGGSYEAGGPIHIAGDKDKTVAVRGRGRDLVTISGGMDLQNCKGVNFQRINFSGTVNVAGGADIGFKNCRFLGAQFGVNAEKVQGLRIENCAFTGFREAGVVLGEPNAAAMGVFLRSNIFDNNGCPAVKVGDSASVAYSDYNSYRDGAKSWQVRGEMVDFPKLQEHYSKILTPDFQQKYRRVILQNASEFRGRGAQGGPIGTVASLIPASELHREGPVLHSVTDTTANLEWWTNYPGRGFTSEVAWGETPACENSETFNVSGFGTYSLTGLKPGTKYYFQFRELPEKRTAATGYGMPPLEKTVPSPTIDFTTAKEASPPATYYVSNTGEDSRDGLSREKAWKSVNHAAALAKPGDTILIAGGTYQEIVRVRTTGEKDRPITYRCAPGEKVIFNGFDFTAGSAFVVAGKSNIKFDGFYFEQFNMKTYSVLGVLSSIYFAQPGAVFELYGSDGITITRCFSDGRKRLGRGGYASAMLHAQDCEDLVVQDCVISNAMHGIWLAQCPGARLENNVFLRNFIMALIVSASPDQKVYLTRNIITDSLVIKASKQLFEMGSYETLVEKDNNYYLRLPDAEKKMFAFYGSKFKTGENPLGRTSLQEYAAEVGGTTSIIGDPGFRITQGMPPPIYESGQTKLFSDVLMDGKGELDFADLFATNPEIQKRGIGLRPENFADFNFAEKPPATP